MSTPVISNRDKLIPLVDGSGLIVREVAQLIADESKRPCSWRAVMSWMADPSRPSARPCPEWVIPILEDGLKRKKEAVKPNGRSSKAS